MLRDRCAGNLTIKSNIYERLFSKDNEVFKRREIKILIGKKNPEHFTVMSLFLKWPISAAFPSELDLGAACWMLAPAVPAEFISGHNYQCQCLREEVVSLTDRQQNTVHRTMEGWSHFTAEERKKWDVIQDQDIQFILYWVYYIQGNPLIQ